MIQTQFSRYLLFYSFRPLARDSKTIVSQLLLEEMNIRVYDTIEYDDYIILLYDEDVMTQTISEESTKYGWLVRFKHNWKWTPKTGIAPKYMQKTSCPLYSLSKNRKRKLRSRVGRKPVDLLWVDSVSSFFLPFKIEANHFMYAKVSS